jgi:acyl-CoA synthetase (AMP-forming)/AMP-acid ligase II
MFHVGGAALTLQVMACLGRQVILPSFDQRPMLEAIQNERGTETFIVPTMLKRLIEYPDFGRYELGSLATMLYGAAPIDAVLLARAMQALPRAGFWQIYGMTELSPAVTALRPAAHRPAPGAPDKLRSAGTPMPAVEVRVVDADGKAVAPGTVGEITVRGPTVMAGYWNHPEQTAQALRGGWMHTGDGGYLDADGFLFVVDRIKDMIITGGENVYSAEVENAIASLPQVQACAAIGVPDAHWGERVHAVVVLRQGQPLTLEQIVAHCRESIAGYKCPRSVEFRTELPLSAAGKVMKSELRSSYREQAPGIRV